MSHCTSCGAPFADPGTRFCTRCGRPRGPENGYQRRGYVALGSTLLPVWLLCLVAVLLLGGGTAAYLRASSHGHAHSSSAYPSPDDEQPSFTDTGPTSPAAPLFPTDTPVETPFDIPSNTSTDPAVAPTGAAQVVAQYYDAINAQDFRTAWDLGGKNLGADSYSSWVDGFSTTQYVRVDAADDPSTPDQADVVVSADQTDGSVRNYRGTYTVSDGVIVDADIHLV